MTAVLVGSPQDELAVRLELMRALSRAVRQGADGGDVLDRIAAEAGRIADADATGILELTATGGFRIVGSHNLTDAYRSSMHGWPTPVTVGRGPSGLAVARQEPVVTGDFRRDFADWAEMPWGAIAAFPLMVESEPIGTLVVYRLISGEWEAEAVHLLELAAEDIAVAIRTATLIAEQKRQVDALERLIAGLREQVHEHSNSLHALAGLLLMHEPDEALSLLERLTSVELSGAGSIESVATDGVLAAMLKIETIRAGRRGVTLEVEQPAGLPGSALTDIQVVTVIGNLLDNALDAVARMQPGRRRVMVRLAADDNDMTIIVRDWGPGLGTGLDWFAPGTTSRPGHLGLGLALAREAVISAHGEITARDCQDGTAFIVRVPLSRA